MTEFSKAQKEFLLEQFRSLRAEQLHNLRSINTLFATEVAATGVIFTVGFSLVPPRGFVFLIPVLIILPITYGVLNYAAAIARLASYIELFVERKFDIGGWEFHLEQMRVYANSPTALQKFRMFLTEPLVQSYVFFVSLLFLIFSFAISFIYLGTQEMWLWSFFCAASLIFVVDISRRLWVLNAKRQCYRKMWSDVLELNPRMNDSGGED